LSIKKKEEIVNVQAWQVSNLPHISGCSCLVADILIQW
jgi:hypothetical protein